MLAAVALAAVAVPVVFSICSMNPSVESDRPGACPDLREGAHAGGHDLRDQPLAFVVEIDEPDFIAESYVGATARSIAGNAPARSRRSHGNAVRELDAPGESGRSVLREELVAYARRMEFTRGGATVSCTDRPRHRRRIETADEQDRGLVGKDADIQTLTAS